MQSGEGADTEWTLVAPRSSRPAWSDGAHDSPPPARKRLDRRPPNDGRSASNGKFKGSVGPAKEGGEKVYTLLRRPPDRERQREGEKERESERVINEDMHQLSFGADAASGWKMVSTATTDQKSDRIQSEDIRLKIGPPIIRNERRRGRRGEDGGEKEKQTGKTNTAGSRTGFFPRTGDAEKCAAESGPTGFRTGHSSQGRRGGEEMKEGVNPQRRGLLVLKKVATEKPPEPVNFDLSSECQWPTIAGTPSTGGCGQEVWLRSAKGWSKVVKETYVPPVKLTVKNETIATESGGGGEGGEGEEPLSVTQNKKRKKKKKSSSEATAMPPAPEKKSGQSVEFDIFERIQFQPARPVLHVHSREVIGNKTTPASRNVLDSTAPAQRRGKERETPKKKKPSSLRKVISKEKEVKKQLREKGLPIPADLDVMKDLNSQSDDEQLPAEPTSHAHLTTPTAPQATPIIQQAEPPIQAAPTQQQTTPTQPQTTPTIPQAKATPSLPKTTPTQSQTTATIPQTKATPTVPQTTPTQPQTAPIIPQTKATPTVHNRRFRQYCTHLVTEEINSATELLLQDLVRFQDRQYQRDPVRARSKRRHVCGLREVQKHLRLGRLKFVVVAPNLDHIQSSGGINDQVAAILSLCHEKKLPVVYALSRRRLACILKKSFKIGCIGIFSYDGAEAHYKKLMKLVDEATEQYQLKISPGGRIEGSEDTKIEPPEEMKLELNSSDESEGQSEVEGPIPEPGNGTSRPGVAADPWSVFIQQTSQTLPSGDDVSRGSGQIGGDSTSDDQQNGMETSQQDGPETSHVGPKPAWSWNVEAPVFHSSLCSIPPCHTLPASTN